MKMKQKMVMVAAIFGLILSLSAALSNNTVFAQETVPSSCLSEPEGERCKQCTDGVLNEQADGCDRVAAQAPKDDSDGSGDTTEECENVKTSIIHIDSCDTENGGAIMALLLMVLNILTAGVGIAAVGGIAYGALLYTTAESKPEQTKKAIGIITNVVIGIAAYALMYVLLNFLIPGGIFT